LVVTWTLALEEGTQADTSRDSKDIAAKSVKEMKLKVSANGRHFVDQDGKPFSISGTRAGFSSNGRIASKSRST
jgi:hypothetical protein